MTSICYFPVVSTEEELIDVISRAAWFLSFCSVSRITIPIASQRLGKMTWSVADGMDDAIAERFAAIREKIVLVPTLSEADLEPCMVVADIILKWRAKAVPEFVTSKKLETWEEGKKVWFVDPQNTRMEGSFYIEAGLHLLDDKEALVRENKLKFDGLMRKLGRFKRAYVMATGPSVWRYKLYNYTDAISLICNSVIFDDELMARVQPQILVFADPIFHFGPSQYAAAFRQRLREVTRIYDFTIVIPFKYYGLFVSTMPELRDRTVAVPFVKDRPFNFDLSREFEVRTTANILTLLLIPLAATFADEIGVLGCDGRPLHEDTYFWGHNQKTQINDKMANIREVHPAFFAIDYNDYYLEHCQTLQSEVGDGERLGKRFLSLGFSHIPALKSRTALGERASCHALTSVQPVQTAIIVDPDAKSWAGHYMAYNEKLSAQFENDGLAVQVICRKDLAAEILRARTNYFPALTSHSWEVGNREENREFIQTFEAEISAAIERCMTSRDGRVLVYMYCGSLDHAEVLLRLAQKFHRLTVNVNLFWMSFRLTPEYAHKWKPFIECLDEEMGAGRIVATLPTVELRDRLAELTGCILPVAPHPSTGVSDQAFEKLLRSEQIAKKTLHVLFPSAPRPEKGYSTSIESARLLCGDPASLRPIVRHAPTYSTPKRLAESLTIEGAEIIEGELTDAEFLELFERSDIVVLPYTPDAFAERTSGLLIDAMYVGIPCVVMRGTWLGNVVEKFGCGVLVDQLSSENLVEGVKEIAANYASYQARAQRARVHYFEKNSWRAFSEFLREPFGAKREEQRRLAVPLVGPYSREQRAHWDETAGVAELFQSTISGATMIDVGAHHGSALIPFLNRGWRIYAFEPDVKNRTKLRERLAKHKNNDRVFLDERCVSNESRQHVSFFTSEQSTGISGLSAFHDTHHESQKVDITTLTEFFREKDMPAVDFLKIDTEGHDLFVLEGYPWEREKPAVIECEFEDSKTVPLGYTFHDMAQFLVEKGYTVYVSEWHPIIRYGIRHDWRQLVHYPCELADSKGWGNLLAFRAPIDEQALVKAVKKVLKAGAGDASQVAAPRQTIELSAQTGRLYLQLHSNFTSAGQNQWRYTHSEAQQKLWIAYAKVEATTAGKEYVGALRLETDRPMTLNISIGRYGNTDYEGATCQVKLRAGVAQTIRLAKTFAQDHAALKLQIEVLNLTGGDSALMTIDVLSLGESPVSIRRGGTDAGISLREANRLFRNGDLSAALDIYLMLHAKRPLKMYANNAFFAARKLGMGNVASVDELRQRVSV